MAASGPADLVSLSVMTQGCLLSIGDNDRCIALMTSHLPLTSLIDIPVAINPHVRHVSGVNTSARQHVNMYATRLGANLVLHSQIAHLHVEKIPVSQIRALGG